MMLYQRTLRPLFFAMPPSWAHHLAMLTMWPIEHWLWLRRIVARLLRVPGPRVHTMGLTFASPVGLAGGFDKDGRRPQALAALGFGFLELGTVTAMPQAENPPPNLFRLPEDRALINRLGFPNDGAHRLAARLLTIGGRGALPVPVGISIGKSRAVPVESLSEVVADYVSSFVAVRDVADYIVVNISSPNTANLRSMQAAAPARALLTALREVNQSSGKALPILVKLSPDLDDEALAGILQVVTDLQLQGVVATNTTITRPRLLTPAPQVQAAGEGGLSGPPLRTRALDMVRQARNKLGPAATIMGVGGIETATHAREFLQAGADLVQVYTGFIYYGPTFASDMAWELNAASK